MAEREIDHGETAVLPEHLRPGPIDALAGAAAEAQRLYQEYVRSLDDVPVLTDVVREPPRVAPKDFRLGQRRDARQAPREDGIELREQHACDLAQQYAEYTAFDAEADSTQCAEPRHAGAKGGRKSRPQKRRAKRAKRLARSKH